MQIIKTAHENEDNAYKMVFYNAIKKKALKITGYNKEVPSDKFVNEFTNEEFTAIGDFINSFVNINNEIDIDAFNDAIELIRENYSVNKKWLIKKKL